MEPLLRQMRELPARVRTLPRLWQAVVAGGLLVCAVVALLAGGGFTGGGDYQYVFANLTPEDATEAGAVLKTASIPFRQEANGAALAVPADKVYDARLLLAQAGLPRGGGVGFELFDRGDLGVSDFTQRVNLRRALEGELSRTVGSLKEVRSARVHLSLGERGLFRGEEKKPSAAVVLNLQPGRTLGDRELAGVRHLVASAVPGLEHDAVTVVDARGTVLTSDPSWDDPAISYQRRTERELEQRLVSILEPVVGEGGVIAKVTGDFDHARLTRRSETVDPDQTALRSERRGTRNESNNSVTPSGVAGAASNAPYSPLVGGAAGSATTTGSSSSEEESRDYEVSKTATETVTQVPRLQRISVAVMLSRKGKPLPETEVARLAEVAKRAVGFDESRGDRLQVSSFGIEPPPEEPALPPPAPPLLAQKWVLPAGGGLALLLVLAAVLVVMRGRRGQEAEAQRLLPVGAKVSELERTVAEPLTATPVPAPAPKAVPPPVVAKTALPATALRERARELALADPTKAAYLLRAWIAADVEGTEERHA